MAQPFFTCMGCQNPVPFERPRLHCQVCEDYDSCTDCQILQIVSLSHTVAHGYHIFLNGELFKPISASPDSYWGSLLAPSKQPSPIFSRLLAAIFSHFDQTIEPKSTGWLEPEKFCCLMASAGYTPQEFAGVTQLPEANPLQLQQLDNWLTGWYRHFCLDPRMETRQFPIPEPPAPVDGRVRMRDRFLNALVQPQLQPIHNGMPKLAMQGLEHYFVSIVLRDPGEAAKRLNNVLGSIPGLIDPLTGKPFTMNHIPRACFPPGPDKDMIEENLRLEEERMAIAVREAHLRLEADHQRNLLAKQAMDNVRGGWKIDSRGNRVYQEGYL